MSEDALVYVALCFAALSVLGMIVALAAVVRLYRRPSDAFVTNVESALQRMGEGVQHYVQVNAVLALTANFENNPQLVHNLSGYSDQVVAAALAYRLDSLGGQLKSAMAQLKHKRKDQCEFGSVYNRDVQRLEEIVAELQTQMDSVHYQIRQRFGKEITPA